MQPTIQQVEDLYMFAVTLGKRSAQDDQDQNTKIAKSAPSRDSPAPFPLRDSLTAELAARYITQPTDPLLLRRTLARHASDYSSLPASVASVVAEYALCTGGGELGSYNTSAVEQQEAGNEVASRVYETQLLIYMSALDALIASGGYPKDAYRSFEDTLSLTHAYVANDDSMNGGGTSNNSFGVLIPKLIIQPSILLLAPLAGDVYGGVEFVFEITLAVTNKPRQTHSRATGKTSRSMKLRLVASGRVVSPCLVHPDVSPSGEITGVTGKWLSDSLTGRYDHQQRAVANLGGLVHQLLAQLQGVDHSDDGVGQGLNSLQAMIDQSTPASERLRHGDTVPPQARHVQHPGATTPRLVEHASRTRVSRSPTGYSLGDKPVSYTCCQLTQFSRAPVVAAGLLLRPA